MTKPLENRLRKLEGHTGSNAGVGLTLMTFVKPGELDDLPSPQLAMFINGPKISRGNFEDEDAYRSAVEEAANTKGLKPSAAAASLLNVSDQLQLNLFPDCSRILPQFVHRDVLTPRLDA